MIGPFTYSEATGRYRDAFGRFVSASEVRRSLDMALENAQRRMLSAAEQLRTGEISLGVWRDVMREDLKEIHLYSAAAARGGWAQMTQADYGRVGRELRDQYLYLENFALELQAEVQRLDGTFISRVKLYAQSGRVTYHATERAVMLALGKTEERNKLRPAEHCAGCLAETARGWVAIGALVPIGDRDCLSNDKCEIEYR